MYKRGDLSTKGRDLSTEGEIRLLRERLVYGGGVSSTEGGSSREYMYIDIYLAMYVCMYVSMHVCMYACMYERLYVCMYVYVCIFCYISH